MVGRLLLPTILLPFPFSFLLSKFFCSLVCRFPKKTDDISWLVKHLSVCLFFFLAFYKFIFLAVNQIRLLFILMNVFFLLFVFFLFDSAVSHITLNVLVET